MKSGYTPGVPDVHDCVGRVVALARYPVKSLQGEAPTEVDVEARGVVGDRLWCVRTEDGGIGSGKTTRRFRRVDRLLELAASTVDGGPPVVRFPDGAVRAAGTPDADAALAAHTGRPLTFVRESTVMHHDEGPLHLLTTSSLRRLGEALGRELDARRFRANVLLDTAALAGLPEVAWTGRRLALGADVVVEVVYPMPRCGMVSMDPQGGPPDGRVLKAVHDVGDGELGVFARVVRPGRLRVGDTAALLS